MLITYLALLFYISKLVMDFLNISICTKYHSITRPVLYHLSSFKVSIMKSPRIPLLDHILIQWYQRLQIIPSIPLEKP